MTDKKIPIALQLYSVRDECQKDFAGTLKAVAEMGYAGVEFAGYYDTPAAELRKRLDALDLKAAGTHTSLESLQGDKLAATIEYNRVLGNRYLIVPALWAMTTAEQWLGIAEALNAIAEQLRPHDMRVGYHNHAVEFQPVDGALPWELIFDNTRPEVVMQFDTGNALHGGADPVKYIKKYPGRAETVHLKEFSASNDKAVIGEGDVPWQTVLELCETVGGTRCYIVEQESYAHGPLKCAELCLQALRGMGR
jgi:sugar phosphate isomerase/epimerase